MKKFLIISAIILALFLCFWYYLLAPYILATKDDFYYVADVLSKDNLYDADKQEFKGEAESKTKFSYRAVGREGNDLLITNFFEVRNLDDQKIFAVERQFKIDPKKDYIFAPRRVDKKPFDYRHVNYDTLAQMQFVGEEELFGLKVYRYQADFHADQTTELGDLPGVGENLGINLDINLQLWIEPVSGQMVNYQDKTTAYYYDLQTQNRRYPWNQFTNTFTPDSVKMHTEIARGEAIKIDLVQRDIPILISIMGVVFALIFCCYRGLAPEGLSLQISASWVWIGTIVTAVVVLLSWTFGIEIFPKANPEYSAMNPITALCFIITSLAAFVRGKQNSKYTTVVLAGILIGFGLTKLSDVFLATQFNTDLWLFAQQILAPNARPSQMSITAALGFIFLGLNFILSLKWSKVGRLFAVIVALIGLSGCFVYAFSEISDLARAFFYSMALNTSTLFFILGLFLSFTHDRINIRDLIKRLLLFLVFVVPLTMTLLATRFAEQTLSEKIYAKFEHETSLIETMIVNKIDLNQILNKSNKNVGTKIYNGSELLYADADIPAQPRYRKTKTIYVGNRPLTVVFTSYPNLYAGSLDKLIPAIFLTLGLTTSVLLLVLFFITFTK